MIQDVPQFRQEGEGEYFHATARKMNYTNEEYADMHLVLGESFFNCWTPSLHFEHRLLIVYLFLFTYFLVK